MWEYGIVVNRGITDHRPILEVRDCNNRTIFRQIQGSVEETVLAVLKFLGDNSWELVGPIDLRRNSIMAIRRPARE